MLLSEFLLVVCGTLVLIYYLKIILRCILHRSKYSHLLPGIRFSCLNLLGNMSDFPLSEFSRNGHPLSAFVLQITAGFAELFRKHKLFCYWVGYTPVIVLVKAEAVQELLSEAKLLKKPWIYEFLQPLLGMGLVTSDVEKWKYNRKLLNPCFRFSILKNFMYAFNHHSRTLIQLLQKEIDKDYTEISTPITLCSLNIINEAVLGVRLEDMNINGSENVKAIKQYETFFSKRIVNCWKWPGILNYILKKFPVPDEYSKCLNHFKWMKLLTKSVFQRNKLEFLSGSLPGTKRKAFVDLLLETHLCRGGFTEMDAVDELDTLLAAGHETTAVGICWALYLIGLHKDVQQKVQEESDFIFGDDYERPVTLEDMKDLKYIDCVIKESRRLYPSIPLFLRELEKDTNICGYKIPQGAICVVPSYAVHRDAEVFPDPEKFDPERFLPDNFAKVRPFAYIPFSCGPRNCIGKNFAMMAEKVIISTIVRNFSIESLDPRDKLVLLTRITLQTTNPIRLKFRPRMK